MLDDLLRVSSGEKMFSHLNPISANHNLEENAHKNTHRDDIIIIQHKKDEENDPNASADSEKHLNHERKLTKQVAPQKPRRPQSAPPKRRSPSEEKQKQHRILVNLPTVHSFLQLMF